MADWPLLASLTPQARRQLLATGRHRRFARREVIFHEGDPGDSLHLVQRGHVAIRIATPLGEVATLTIVGPGEAFGELALLDQEANRSATAVALERTETWTLHRAQFSRLRAEDPAIDQILIDLLAAYVRRLSEHLVEALYLPADKRVTRRILDLAGTYAAESEIPLTQEDLANLAGTSRATVNRVLGELERDRVLVAARGRIRVLDPQGLAKAAR